MNKLKEKIQDLLVDIRYSANHIQDHIFECDDICDEYIQDILDDCVLLQELIDQTKTPTLEECIKEWEEEGYLCEKTKFHFYIEEVNGNVIATFSLLDNYFCTTMFINSKRVNLLTKTLKALEVEDAK